MLERLLFKYIDNSALILFRILFGFLISAEAFGAIITGWVKQVFIDPKFTFTFIGFEWLQPLAGNYMYVHFSIMGLLGIFVMLGYRYRISMIAYSILWTVSYFMQKSSYNNHYYLMILLCSIMAILPANRYKSLDVKFKSVSERHSMPMWCSWILILQLGIVYTYAAVAKIYPDWLDTTVIELFMRAKTNYYVIGDLLQEKWLHYLVAYGGILFDAFIIPMLLFKRTRKWAFIASIIFHLFNSIVFQIGVFPYMSLALCVFFFEPESIRKLFFKNKPSIIIHEVHVPNYKGTLVLVFSIYFMIQIALPLRHWFFKDNVLWTDEGHRLSWRMMLRGKSGTAQFSVVDKKTGEKSIINLDDYLSRKQKHLVVTQADAIWQFAQVLKTEYLKKGKDVEVFVRSHLSVNGRPHSLYIDSEVDLGSIMWNAFKHSEWILPSKLN